MIKVFIADNKEKIKEIINEMLNKSGNADIYIKRQADTIEIMGKDDILSLVSLKDKVVELEASLYDEKKGILYKTVLEIIERLLIEYALERSEGNQIKAAKALGINRNTIRTKIRKLGIDAHKWKVI